MNPYKRPRLVMTQEEVNTKLIPHLPEEVNFPDRFAAACRLVTAAEAIR